MGRESSLEAFSVDAADGALDGDGGRIGSEAGFTSTTTFCIGTGTMISTAADFGGRKHGRMIQHTAWVFLTRIAKWRIDFAEVDLAARGIRVEVLAASRGVPAASREVPAGAAGRNERQWSGSAHQDLNAPIRVGIIALLEEFAKEGKREFRAITAFRACAVLVAVAVARAAAVLAAAAVARAAAVEGVRGNEP